MFARFPKLKEVRNRVYSFFLNHKKASIIWSIVSSVFLTLGSLLFGIVATLKFVMYVSIIVANCFVLRKAMIKFHFGTKVKARVKDFATKYLYTDRRRIAASAIIGSFLIVCCGILLKSNISFLTPIAILTILFTYIFFPLLMFKDRDIRIGIDPKDSTKWVFLNADGEDITKRIPNYPIVIFFVGFFVIMTLMNLSHDSFIFLKRIKSISKSTYNILEWLDDMMIIIIPYLVMHVYCFWKNIPNSVYALFFTGSSVGSSTSSSSSSSFSSSSSSSTSFSSSSSHINSPSYSSLSCNSYTTSSKR